MDVLADATMTDSSRQVPETCIRCHSELVITDALYLWDGRWYCRDCVRRHSELLEFYATRHSVLTDRVSLKAALAVCTWKALSLNMLLYVVTFPLLFRVFSGMQLEIVLVSGLYFVLSNARIIIDTVGTWPQEMRIMNGQVEVRRPFRTKRIPMLDCKWRLDGRMDDGLYPFCWVLPKPPAIALRAGSFWNRFDARACIDDDTRQVWTAFLTLAAQN